MDPALGLVGESLTPLAFAAAAPPPGGGGGGGADSSTTMVIEAASLDGSLSISEIALSPARNVYVPFWAATTFQTHPALLRPVIGWRSPVWHSPVVGVLVHCSVGSGPSAPSSGRAELGAKSPLGGDRRDQRDVDKDVEVAARHRDGAAVRRQRRGA